METEAMAEDGLQADALSVAMAKASARGSLTGHERLLTPEQVGSYLGYKKSTIRNLISAGVIRVVYLTQNAKGGEYGMRVDKVWLDQWLDGVSGVRELSGLDVDKIIERIQVRAQELDRPGDRAQAGRGRGGRKS
jgi:hypothetical protein